MRFHRKIIFCAVLAVFLIPLLILPETSEAAAVINTGISQPFSISKDYSFSGKTQTGATLRVAGEKGQYFVEDEYWNAKNYLEQQEILRLVGKLSDEFDSKIYPVETNFWGPEASPGIDNDPKVVVLLANLVDTAGGYYDTGNQFSKTRVPESNERDMIYLNIRSLRTENKIYGFLAHEFQHLISFNQKYLLRQVNDDIWLNELRSEYSITLAGYNDAYDGSNLKRRVAAFLEEPSDSLTEWTNQAVDYGQINLLAEYLVEHFGSDILKKSLHSNLVNMESLGQALRDNGFNLDFEDVFLRWSAANALNDILLSSDYGYFREGLRQDFKISSTRLVSGVSDNGIFSLTEAFKDWQTKWIWVTDLAAGNKNVLKISFNGAKKEFFKGAVIIFHRDSRREVRFFDLSDANQQNQFFDLTPGLEKIILIPVKMERTSGFTNQESLSDLIISFERVAVPVPEVASPLVESPSPSLTAWTSPQQKGIRQLADGTGTAHPADFGLREGDFIRAEGDIDVYIINDFGFKRLVLNPQICLLYGHLGARGCFAAVKTVFPQTRDAFKTSLFFTNGETKDGQVYFLELTGDDSAVLRLVNMPGEEFIRQGGNFSAVFLFNIREQKTYPDGADLKQLSSTNF